MLLSVFFTSYLIKQIYYIKDYLYRILHKNGHEIIKKYIFMTLNVELIIRFSFYDLVNCLRLVQRSK